MTGRPIVVLALAAALVALSACASPPAPAPTATVTATVTTSPTPSPTATGQVDPNAPSGQCADDALQVAVTQIDAGAGNIGYEVRFTNTGDQPCELRGYPGVSVVGDGNGTQLGPSATETTGPEPQTVTVAPQQSVAAPLQAVNIEGGGGPLGDACQVAQGDGWRIYPPHSFTAVFVPAAGQPACTDLNTPWLTVGPVAVG